MEKVAIAKCHDYEEDTVKAAVNRAINSLGGLKDQIKPGETVFLKLNLLMKKRPDEAVTTHPLVVKAVAEEIQKLGAKVVIGDSPGGPFTKSMLKSVYSVCGIEEVANKVGAELNYNTNSVEFVPSLVAEDSPLINKKFTLCEAMVSADKIVSLSKLKTHGMTKFTGAVKVLFGCIPGLEKVEYHLRMPDVKDFSNMLIDLALTVKPCLHLIDGVIGMEGEGPSGGIPKKAGVIMASTNPFALDVVAVSAIGINLEAVPTVLYAKERGLIGSLDDVEVIGDEVNFPVTVFTAPEIKKNVRFPLPNSINNFLEQYLSPKPVFSEEICIKCGDCLRSCPPKILTMGDKKPEINLDKCIRCFCCQELCPKKAVTIKRPWLTKKLLK